MHIIYFTASQQKRAHQHAPSPVPGSSMRAPTPVAHPSPVSQATIAPSPAPIYAPSPAPGVHAVPSPSPQVQYVVGCWCVIALVSFKMNPSC